MSYIDAAEVTIAQGDGRDLPGSRLFELRRGRAPSGA